MRRFTQTFVLAAQSPKKYYVHNDIFRYQVKFQILSITFLYFIVKRNKYWRILTSHEIYAMVTNPTVTETKKLNRLCWFGHVQRMEDNRIPKKVLYMNLETTRLRGRPRNRGQDDVREDGNVVGGKGWNDRVYNKEEWKKLLRKARDHHILHMPME